MKAIWLHCCAFAVLTACSGGSGPTAAGADAGDLGDAGQWDLVPALVSGDVALGDVALGDAGADAALAQDVTAVASLAPPACPLTEQAVACYHKCAPAPNAPAPDLPKPPTCADDYHGLNWQTSDNAPPGPASLQIEIGAADPDTGAFVPYQSGQWAPIVEGVQGGIHVWAAVRVPLPKGSAQKAILEVAGHILQDCQVVATELLGTSKAIALPDPAHPGLWTNASKLVPGIPVAFEKSAVTSYCGQWVTLVVQVRDVQSGQWGQAWTTLRLWDLDNL